MYIYKSIFSAHLVDSWFESIAVKSIAAVTVGVQALLTY